MLEVLQVGEPFRAELCPGRAEAAGPARQAGEGGAGAESLPPEEAPARGSGRADRVGDAQGVGVRRVVDEQRGRFDPEGARDPLQDAVRQGEEADFGAEGAGEIEQGGPVLVPVPVEAALEPPFERAAEGREQQRQRQRRQAQGRQHRVRGEPLEPPRRHEEEEEVEGPQERGRPEPGRGGARDPLHVHQAEMDEGVPDRQRDQGERKDRRFHGEGGAHPEGDRQPVGQGEGEDARQGPVPDPFQLLAGDEVPVVPPLPQEAQPPGQEGGAEKGQLRPVDDKASAGRSCETERGQVPRDPEKMKRGEHEGRGVGQKRGPPAGGDGEAMAEMEEERREEEEGQRRERVDGPVEEAQARGVAVEPEDEGGQADQEKVRGRAGRPAAPQYVEPDAEVEEGQQRLQSVPGRKEGARPEPEAHGAHPGVPRHLVGVPGTGGEADQQLRVPARVGHLQAVDRQQPVARPDPGRIRPGFGAEPRRPEGARGFHPEDPVRRVGPAEAVPEIQDARGEQDGGEECRGDDPRWHCERVHGRAFISGSVQGEGKQFICHGKGERVHHGCG